MSSKTPRGLLIRYIEDISIYNQVEVVRTYAIDQTYWMAVDQIYIYIHIYAGTPFDMHVQLVIKNVLIYIYILIVIV